MFTVLFTASDTDVTMILPDKLSADLDSHCFAKDIVHKGRKQLGEKTII